MSDIAQCMNKLEDAARELELAEEFKTSAPDLYALFVKFWEAARDALEAAYDTVDSDPDVTPWCEDDEEDSGKEEPEDYDENNSASTHAQTPKKPTPAPAQNLVSGEGGKIDLGEDKGKDKANDEETTYGPKNPFKIGDLTRDEVPSYLSATKAEYFEFKKKVYKRCVKSGSNRRPFAMGIASGDQGTLRGQTVHKDIVKDATDLMEAAEKAIKDLKAAKDKSVSKAKDEIGLASTYRTAPHQFRLWNSRFTGTYMQRHHEALAELEGDELSNEWVRFIARKIGNATATPGYSLHQLGISLDFAPPEAGLSNKKPAKHQKKWKKTWFHGWLEENAETYGFEAYSGEAWHWNYTSLMPD